MTLELFGHPFSSYCWKAAIALDEMGADWTWRVIEPGSEWTPVWEKLWPIKRFPVLRDGERVVAEASAIIEYLHVHHRSVGDPLIPDDGDAAVIVRMLDRFFDHYVSDPQARFVFNAIRPADQRDPLAEQEGGAMLERSYGWLEGHIAGREWATGEAFSMADCAAAPALFYADWTYPFGDRFPAVTAYRQRLLARPSIARAVDGGRPYRAFFPLGAPDRD
ncbi:glutathione S-transferase family protein [Sphingomonas sp. AX6]|uniref:glutathione S-transferase family protein n=1 Tax=Sphingomonas sp. AX6 TaxID=2653171 RepID=UPI0012F0748A|nr:glutathione S-transferase family protein [Sphingomonas sp. AX6]VXC78028.1 Glutathione S-transferase [Sphingomonas sp. AX6]